MRKTHLPTLYKTLIFGLYLTLSNGLQASSFDMNGLQSLIDANSSSGKAIANSVNEAIQFSMMKPIKRSKVPGPFKLFVETGGSIFDIDDSLAAAAITGGFAPDSFKSFFAKVGAGLPYGTYADIGVSTLLNEVELTGIHLNLAYQVLDLVNTVYTDMVPSAAVSFGFNYIVDGPDYYGVQGQLLLGAYHRYLWAQINYVLQVSYGSLNDVSNNQTYFRHGLVSYWPLYEGLFLTQDFFIRPVEATVSLGYQF